MNTGTDYEQILGSLAAYSSWVDANVGNASLVDRYAAPGSTFDGAARHDLDILNRLNRRQFETNSGPADITILDRRPGIFTAKYVQHLVSQTVVDAHGNVTSEHRYSAPTTTYIIVVSQAHDGRWRIADVEPLGGSK